MEDSKCSIVSQSVYSSIISPGKSSDATTYFPSLTALWLLNYFNEQTAQRLMVRRLGGAPSRCNQMHSGFISDVYQASALVMFRAEDVRQDMRLMVVINH